MSQSIGYDDQLCCPCCGAILSAEVNGSGVCEVTGLVLPATLFARLAEAYPVRERVVPVLDDAYFEARWRCPGCGSPLAEDESTCSRCHKSLHPFAIEILAANPTRCGRQ